MMLGLVALGGCLPVALFVRSPQLLAAVNSVSMVFLLFFCCILAMLPFSPTPNTGAHVGSSGAKRSGCGGVGVGAGGAYDAGWSSLAAPNAVAALILAARPALQASPQPRSTPTPKASPPAAALLPTGILAWWRWEGVLVAFPIVSYGFTAHQYLFQIYPARWGARPHAGWLPGALAGEGEAQADAGWLPGALAGWQGSFPLPHRVRDRHDTAVARVTLRSCSMHCALPCRSWPVPAPPSPCAPPRSQRPSMRKMTTAVQRGMLLSAAIYVAVGAGGYTAFGTR